MRTAVPHRRPAPDRAEARPSDPGRAPRLRQWVPLPGSCAPSNGAGEHDRTEEGDEVGGETGEIKDAGVGDQARTGGEILAPGVRVLLQLQGPRGEKPPRGLAGGRPGTEPQPETEGAAGPLGGGSLTGGGGGGPLTGGPPPDGGDAGPADGGAPRWLAEVVRACTGTSLIEVGPGGARPSGFGSGPPGQGQEGSCQSVQPVEPADLLAEPGVEAVVLLTSGPPPADLTSDLPPGVHVASLNELMGNEHPRGVEGFEGPGGVESPGGFEDPDGAEDAGWPQGADRLVALILGAQHPPRARVIAVTAARGGLGASTLLLHLARALAAQGCTLALLDLDPAGGLGLLIGESLRPGLHWADLPDGEQGYRHDLLIEALPTWLGMPVLTGDGRGGAREGVPVPALLDVLCAHHDMVLIDLPRGAEPPTPCEVLLLSALDLRSALAAEALVHRLRRDDQGEGDPGGSGPDAAGSLRLVVLDRAEDVLVEDLQEITGCQVAGVIPWDRSVAQRVARGDDPTRARGGMRRRARSLARTLLAEPQRIGS